MRVLVTGAAGFIGSHLCEALLAGGRDVIGLDAFVDSYARADKEANLAVLRRQPGFSFMEADLRTDDLDPSLTGVEAVVNCAAMAGLPRSWRDIDAYAGCNLIAVQRLLDACTRSKIDRFVQISTSSVYGEDAIGDEGLPTRPISPYGVTKLAAEHLVHAYRATHGLPAVILRYFSVYGPRQRPDMAYHVFIEALLDGRSLQVYGDGSQSRSSTFVSDCVRGTIRALDHAPEGETYNVGGGDRVTLSSVIEQLGDLIGVEPVVRHLPPRPGDQRHTRADVRKAERDFGFEAITTPAEGLREQVAWHRERRSRSA